MNMRRIGMVLAICMLLITLLPAPAGALEEPPAYSTPFVFGDTQLGRLWDGSPPELPAADDFQPEPEDVSSLFGDASPKIYVGGVEMAFGGKVDSQIGPGFAQLGVVQLQSGEYVPALLLSDYVYSGPGCDITTGRTDPAADGIFCGIYSDWPLYILLDGENEITRTNNGEALYGNAIGVGSQHKGDLLASVVICDYSGDGSLTAIDEGNCEKSYGLYCYGYVNILGGAVTAQSGSTKASAAADITDERQSCGIYGAMGVYISGGDVTATGGASIMNTGAGYYYSAGILVEFPFLLEYNAERLQISGDAKVTATGGKVKGKDGLSAGLFAAERFIVIGNYAEVTATGGLADGNGSAARSYGIGSGTLTGYDTKGGVVAITNSAKVEATGGKVIGANPKSVGIFCLSTINGVMLNGGSVTAKGGESAAGSSFGIQAAPGSSFSGGQIVAKCASSNATSYRAFANETMDLSGYNSYQWRLTDSGSYQAMPYVWADQQTYVEIIPLLSRPSSRSASQTQVTIPVTGDEGSINAAAQLKDGTARLSFAAPDLADISGSVSLDLSELEKPVTGATLSGGAFEQLAHKADSLTLQLPDSSVNLDGAALAAVAEQANGADVTVSIAKLDQADLDKDVLALTGDRPVYDISISAGGKEIHDLGNGKATIRLPYSLREGEDPENIVIWRMVDGAPQPVPCRYNSAAGIVAFETGSFSLYAVAHFPFADVPANSWYYANVAYVYQNGLMKGVSQNSFAPAGRVSRAMLVTALHRLAGEPVVNYYMTFPDVDAEAWYGEAVRWAAGEGIVKGYSDGRFGPADPLTREQMAAILYRYEQSTGGGFVGSWMFLLDYDDRDQVSDWAYEALCWCTMKGVIEGSGGNLLPTAACTRAELAAVLNRFATL